MKNVFAEYDRKKDNKEKVVFPSIVVCRKHGNRVNQKFFKKKFKPFPNKPWLAQLPNSNKPTFLLHDYVHVLKCIRNNWLTEENGELDFVWNGEKFTAKWNILRHLHLIEQSNLLKLSKLTQKAVFPKPVERQDVSLVLKVFCYETIAALEIHPDVDKEDAKGTIQFLKIILGWWKIVNTKEKGEKELFKDDLRGPIESHDDQKLKILEKVAVMAERMTAPGKERVRKLTTDTGTAFQNVCRGMIDLSHYMLNAGNDYVILGWFTTDPLEKTFGKLRQGSGGAYFITVQSVVEKIRIQRAKLCLELGVRIEGSDGHQCEYCVRKLDEFETEVFDSLPDLEDKLNADTMLSLIYIAGCVEKKHQRETTDTTEYYERHSAYLDALDRGQLCVPGDNIAQWTIYCFVLFTQFSEDLCRKFVIAQFTDIAEKYCFDVTPSQCRVLANIFMNNYSILKSPDSTKEARLKELKLE